MNIEKQTSYKCSLTKEEKDILEKMVLMWQDILGVNRILIVK